MDYYWSEDGPGAALKAEKGLGSVRPVMCTTRQSGNTLYMFEADSKFYLWNLIEDSVFHITSPDTESEIIQKITEDDVKGLDLEEA